VQNHPVQNDSSNLSKYKKTYPSKLRFGGLMERQNTPTMIQPYCCIKAKETKEATIGFSLG